MNVKQELEELVKSPLADTTIPSAPFYIELMKSAINSDGGVEKLEKLMLLQEQWENRQAKKAFYEAFTNFQAQLPIIPHNKKVKYKTKTGGFIEYTHALMKDIFSAIQKPLNDNNLSYRFNRVKNPNDTGNSITVECIVSHKGGHFISTEMTAFPDTSGNKDQLKSMASTESHLRRYTLTGVLGLISGDMDDDGIFAENKTETNIKMNPLYPDREFQNNFPIWKDIIDSGKNTTEQIVHHLTSKNINLSESQKEQILALQK